MGVAAGFLGGAAIGAVGTMAMYSTYHRYNMYRQMMYMNNPHMYGYNAGYYNNYYNRWVTSSIPELNIELNGNVYFRNICRDGCPMNAHCEWGFCECNAGNDKELNFASLYSLCLWRVNKEKRAVHGLGAGQQAPSQTKGLQPVHHLRWEVHLGIVNQNTLNWPQGKRRLVRSLTWTWSVTRTWRCRATPASASADRTWGGTSRVGSVRWHNVTFILTKY